MKEVDRARELVKTLALAEREHATCAYPSYHGEAEVSLTVLADAYVALDTAARGVLTAERTYAAHGRMFGDLPAAVDALEDTLRANDGIEDEDDEYVQVGVRHRQTGALCGRDDAACDHDPHRWVPVYVKRGGDG